MIKPIVDSREHSYIRTVLLKYNWAQQALSAGDYLFNSAQHSEQVCITRKTIEDLLSSMHSGFGNQLEEMLNLYDKNIILLEGKWSCITDIHLKRRLVTSQGVNNHYTWNMVWNFLRTWQDRGFTIEITLSMRHTVDRILSLYKYYQKPEHTGCVKLVGHYE